MDFAGDRISPQHVINWKIMGIIQHKSTRLWPTFGWTNWTFEGYDWWKNFRNYSRNSKIRKQNSIDFDSHKQGGSSVVDRIFERKVKRITVVGCKNRKFEKRLRTILASNSKHRYKNNWMGNLVSVEGIPNWIKAVWRFIVCEDKNRKTLWIPRFLFCLELKNKNYGKNKASYVHFERNWHLQIDLHHPQNLGFWAARKGPLEEFLDHYQIRQTN